MLSKLTDEFLIDYLKRAPYATKEELTAVLLNVELLIRQNKDKSLEEIIDLIIQDNIQDFEIVRKKYGVPGVTACIKVANFNVLLYGGNLNYLGEKMPDNALFDIASMTKFYTQIIAYNLIKDGFFRRSDKIINLDKRFKNLGDLTVDDILTFGTTFKTDGLIRDKKTIDEALNTVFNTKVIETGKWNYNDIGLIIIKEVMENLTGLSYNELLYKYVINPLNLEDTHLIVPKNKYHLITGTPNFSDAKINDMTANALGGYSGHAGIFASANDVVTFLSKIRNKNRILNISDAYTPGKLNDAIGIMGNVYTSNPLGLEKTFVDTKEPKDTFAIAGSTRVNAASSQDSAYTVMYNPSSMDIDDAKRRMEIINKERLVKGLKPIEAVKEFEFNRDGKLIKYKLIDPRQLLPVDSMAESVRKIAITTLKLRFLNFIVQKYDTNMKNIDISRNIK